MSKEYRCYTLMSRLNPYRTRKSFRGTGASPLGGQTGHTREQYTAQSAMQTLLDEKHIWKEKAGQSTNNRINCHIKFELSN